MANGVPVWSMTAASNSTADDSINWAESQAPSSVNDSARAMMARIAEWYADTSGNLVLGGTSTAYTLTTNNVFASLIDGATVVARINATSGATPTLAVDGLTAKQIRGVYGTNIATGALLINSIWAFTYDSTDDAWIAWGNTLAAGQLLTATDITGATALTAPAIDDELPTYDLSATANRKITTVNLFKVVATFAAETSPAIDDELLLYDLSTTTADKITTANLLKVINGLTEDTSPHVSNDFLVTYDASATAAKKLTLTNLVAAFLTAGLTSRNTAKAVAFFSVSAGVVSFTSGNWFNVASITRTGTGAFTVTFTNALSSANYVLTGGGIPTSSLSIGTGVTATSKATTGFTLNTFRMGAGAEDPLECDFAII